MSFETLLVIVLAGLGGPLIALSGRRFVPIVVGEILAGVLIGDTGLRIVDPTDPGLSFLGQVGFAMLMLTVGMHLPLRDRRLSSALRDGAMLALLVGVLAVPAAFAAAALTGSSHVAVYAVVLASGSAAVLLPAVQESGATGTQVFTVMAQVTIADVVTILSVPIVLQPGRTTHALLGGLLVVLTMVALLALARLLKERDWVHDVRRLSKRRHWALDLRLSLLILFLLAWIAQRSGTSVLIAGFAAGVMVALIGGPKRLSTQMRGIADGFFVPLYFVLLGAQLDLRGLFSDPTMVALACVLAALNVVIHLVASSLRGLPASAGLTASAQLGVPAAVASLGLAEHVLSPQVATAIVAASLVSLAVCTLGVESLLAPRPPAPDARRASGPKPGLRASS